MVSFDKKKIQWTKVLKPLIGEKEKRMGHQQIRAIYMIQLLYTYSMLICSHTICMRSCFRNGCGLNDILHLSSIYDQQFNKRRFI